MSQKCIVLQTYQAQKRGFPEGDIETRYRYTTQDGDRTDGGLQHCINEALKDEGIILMFEEIDIDKVNKQDEIRKLIREELQQIIDVNELRPSPETFAQQLRETMEEVFNTEIVKHKK